ncbi:hypothetical protein CKR_2754 [Clostridium kluyveri NBRC 12016]|uniref:Uncharacterized protein n=2 Tax=Clostridium kluyveri TaxID=1534 RepID=A5N1X6_CLOK5|nr:Conserved hypothetical protein [Clostridium kluyveri DSM 555]BAH07805.1 hypothetical protein CKR_2754 [Clostridium kluyveri NBRC 12016]
MFKLHWIEILLRGIPESFLMLAGVCVIAKKSLPIKNYIISSISLSLCIFFIRRLPVYWGIHTLIVIVLTISLLVIQGMPLISSSYGTLCMLLILSGSEVLNILILNIFHIKTTLLYVDSIGASIKKCLLGMPSLIMVFLFILVIYHFKNKHINLSKI